MEEQNKVAGPAIGTVMPSDKSLPFVIKPAKSVSRYLKGLVYGDYGVGKTTLVASAADVPEMSDVIFIDAESGTKVIEDRDDIDVVTITAYSQFARIYEYLKLHCKARDANDIDTLRKLESMFKRIPAEQIETPKRYKTVIVDSLTEVQKYCMYQLLGIKVGEAILDVEPDAPQFSEWNKSAEMIRLLVRSFRNLDMNVLFVCSRDEDKDERNQFVFVPNLPGKLALEINGFFDMVGFMVAAPNADNTQMLRRLYLVPSRTWKAKHRFTSFRGAYIDNPSMKEIWKLNQQ